MIGDSEYAGLTASRIAALVSSREVSAREVTEAALARLDAVDTNLRAFTECWPERALRRAEEVDRAAAEGRPLPFAGVPLGVKAWEISGSVQLRRLVAAGCVPIGATAVPSGRDGWQTWGHTERGPTTNPWCPSRTPGGSSAGSAAAVAARIVPIATAIDGAGSTRIPAAWCGVLGVKVTNGLVPTRDASGLAAPGPLCRAAPDAGRYLEVISNGSVSVEPRPRTRPTAAWSVDLGFAEVDPEVASVARRAAQRLAQAGIVDEREATVRLRDPAPAWSARRAGAPEAGTADTAGVNEQRLRRAFAEVELLMTPTTPAPPHGHSGPGEVMNTALTWAFNISGHPALSMPAGFTRDGCPVGLQLVGRHRAEARLLSVAVASQGDQEDMAASRAR